MTNREQWEQLTTKQQSLVIHVESLAKATVNGNFDFENFTNVLEKYASQAKEMKSEKR